MINFIKGGFLAAFIFFTPLNAQNFVLFNEGVLNDKVVEQINTIGTELYNKIGVFVAVAVGDMSDFDTIKGKKNELKAPFALLVLSKSSHKVDIITSKEVGLFFDKEQVLSPYSGEGTILPILASNKGKDIYNAAILNGYADITERIARYFNIKLENSIGNANRDTLNVLRIGIYGFLCIAALYYVQRKVKKRRYENE